MHVCGSVYCVSVVVPNQIVSETDMELIFTVDGPVRRRSVPFYVTDQDVFQSFVDTDEFRALCLERIRNTFLYRVCSFDGFMSQPFYNLKSVISDDCRDPTFFKALMYGLAVVTSSKASFPLCDQYGDEEPVDNSGTKLHYLHRK